MNWKTWAPLLIAIVLGLAAAKLASDLIRHERGQRHPAQGVSIVVAKDDVPPGQELKAEDLAVSKLITDHLPSHAYGDPARLIGRITKASLVKGQAILESLLAPAGSGTGLQALVPPGMRAITIGVTESSGVAGLLTPGCHVDVLATIAGDNQKAVSKIVVQNLKVTAVGQKLSKTTGEEDKDKDASHTVTLLATPKDAEVLELLASTGHPRLVLRSSSDKGTIDITGTALSDLCGGEQAEGLKGTIFDTSSAPAPVAVADKPSGRTVTVIRGGVQSKVFLPEQSRTALTGIHIEP